MAVRDRGTGGAVTPAACRCLVRALGGVLAAGVLLLLTATGAASLSLLPGQLDTAGRQACSSTLGVPTAAQQAEAVALARRSGEGGLQEAAGPAAVPADERFEAVQHWCASND